MKRLLILLGCACMLFGCACAEQNEMAIVLADDQITVNGEAISENADESIYLARQVEIHEDIPEELEGLSNRVVTITDAGIYRFSGTAGDAQIAVRAGVEDDVRIILDGVDITCRTAPAIAVISAHDPRLEGHYGVTFELVAGSVNNVIGSHTEEISEDDVKLSGAISSLVSIGFEGDGYLIVDADNEGIETKYGHMTFNGGKIIVNSGDDSLNASEDGVSVITINDGTLHLQVKPDAGGEGDGIDSNGSIVINGGVVASYSHPDSMDSGIDSYLGCTINGGIVLGMGNMYDEISVDSVQPFMVLQFAQPANDTIVVTDPKGKLVAAAHMPSDKTSYSSFVFSSPDFVEGDYHFYLGGEITAENGKAIYTPGTQLQHGGMMGGRMGPGGMQKPDDMPEPPEGMEFPEGMQAPQMGQFDPGDRGFGGGRMHGFGGMAFGEASTVFHLAPGSTMFSGITTVK